VELKEELKHLDLEPIMTRVIVKQMKVDKVGSIVIPKTNQGVQPTEGMVLATGPDVTEVEPGDIVFYGRYAGAVVERGLLDKHEFQMMEECDIIAKVKPNGGSNGKKRRTN
jgi:co-chaperonin GroES (HSP10)